MKVTQPHLVFSWIKAHSVGVGSLFASILAHSIVIGYSAFDFGAPPILMPTIQIVSLVSSSELNGVGQRQVGTVSESKTNKRSELRNSQASLPEQDPIAVRPVPISKLRPKAPKAAERVQNLTSNFKEDSHQVSEADGSAGTTATESGGGNTASGARGIYAPQPTYPAAARLAGFEGIVLFEATIDPRGSVIELRLIDSSGRADCDDSAREAILNKWRFEPALIMGRPALSRLPIAVDFSLDYNDGR